MSERQCDEKACKAEDGKDCFAYEWRSQSDLKERSGEKCCKLKSAKRSTIWAQIRFEDGTLIFASVQLARRRK